MYKFRSMKVHLSADQCFSKEMNYTTAGGRKIRKCSLDELPQLFNVLKGDMSLIGLRPLKPCEAKMYDNGRFETRPGCSGALQLHNTQNLSFAEREQLEYQFLQEGLRKRIYYFFKTIGFIYHQKNQ